MKKLALPPGLKSTLEKSKLTDKISFDFAAGTFSASGTYNRKFGNRQITEYNSVFRQMKNGVASADVGLNTGTVNLSALGHSNQIVLLMVNVAPSKNGVERFLRYADKLADDERIVAAAWMPDGLEGTVMVDREVSNYTRWIAPTGVGLKFWGVILGLTLVLTLLSCVVPCLITVFPLVGGYAYHQYIQKKRSQGMLTDQDFQNLLNQWCLKMMEDGTFERAYLEGFGIQTGESERL